MLRAMRRQNRPTSGGDIAPLAFAVIAADRCRPPDSLPEIRDPLKRLSLFRPCPQLTRQVEIRTASVGVGCYASSALVLERLSPKSFCPFVHDVKTTSRAIRFRGPFTVALREDVPHCGGRRSSSGSLAILAAMRRASSLASSHDKAEPQAQICRRAGRAHYLRSGCNSLCCGRVLGICNGNA